MIRFVAVLSRPLGLAVWFLTAWGAAAGQSFVGQAAKQQDVRVLDSLVLSGMGGANHSLEGLASRDALIELMMSGDSTPHVAWGLALHRWIRSAGDAHLRVRFDLAATERLECALPPAMELLDPNGPWAGFGPGLDVAASARHAWLTRTWPWVGGLGGCSEAALSAPLEPIAEGAKQAPAVDKAGKAGMAVVEREQYVHWTVGSFGAGSDRAFRRAFRKCRRQVRQSGLPILLDLRGNLGGYRTRRHAVLHALVAPSRWPQEWDRKWGDKDAKMEEVPPMPAVKTSRRMEAPLAVVVDGLSFSASLLLVDALNFADRAKVFGCAPLGQPGGCSGSPTPHTLPGSTWRVDVPQRASFIGLNISPVSHYGLSGAVVSDVPGVMVEEAVWWLCTQVPAP